MYTTWCSRLDNIIDVLLSRLNLSDKSQAIVYDFQKELHRAPLSGKSNNVRKHRVCPSLFTAAPVRTRNLQIFHVSLLPWWRVVHQIWRAWITPGQLQWYCIMHYSGTVLHKCSILTCKPSHYHGFQLIEWKLWIYSCTENYIFKA